MQVNPARIFSLKKQPNQTGPIVYWMQRDQRAADNWALLFAQQQALSLKQPLLVVFCLVPGFLGANIRHYGFMIKGLRVVEETLRTRNIPFSVIMGEPVIRIPEYLKEVGAGMLITDFNPIRISLEWKRSVAEQVNIPVYEVDAHNILPCRAISDKLEYAAFTLRKKVEKGLTEFLTDFPDLIKHPYNESFIVDEPIDWKKILDTLTVDRSVAEVNWLIPGESAALEAWNLFLHTRFNDYATKRNFPDNDGQSGLSPYLHFGHISAQRLAIDLMITPVNSESKMAFLEELIVRRELADNYCLHCQDYDSFNGFQPWARLTLNKHRDDPRDYHYSTDQFEFAQTHDPLWNAAQKEMINTGKMHGFMRMYWAKKILEWSKSPEEAMAIAIYVNDKYELDGRDPNGYAGIAWAIGGVHDRPWGERKIFGMIRYMNYEGCKRKFDIKKYIRTNV